MEINKNRGKLTIFKAEMAEKYGAPVYSRQPPITAIFPGTNTSIQKAYLDTR